MRHVNLTRQMNGMITIIFQKVTLFLFLKDEMRLPARDLDIPHIGLIHELK